MIITFEQATKIMDTIAEKSCNLVGFSQSPNCNNEETFTNAVCEKTRETFCAICDILNITEVEEE